CRCICSALCDPHYPRSPPFPYTTLFRSNDGPGFLTPVIGDRGAAVFRRNITRGNGRNGETAILDGTVARHLLGRDGSRRRTTGRDRKSTRLNSSHVKISYAVFCLKKKKT